MVAFEFFIDCWCPSMYYASSYFCNGLSAVILTSDPRTVLCLLRKVIVISFPLKFQVIFNLVASSRYLLFCNFSRCYLLLSIEFPLNIPIAHLRVSVEFFLGFLLLMILGCLFAPHPFWSIPIVDGSVLDYTVLPHPYFVLSSIPIFDGSRLDYPVLPHPVGF